MMSHLPPTAIDALAALREEADDAAAIVMASYEKLKDANAAAVATRAAVSDLVSRNLPYASEQIAALRKDADSAVAAQAEASRKYTTRQAAADPLRNLLQRVEAYVSRLNGPVLDVSLPDARPAKGQTLAHAVDEVRAAIGDKKLDRSVAQNAPLTAAEAKRIARVEIDALAESGRIDVEGAVESGAELGFPFNRRPGQTISLSRRFSMTAEDVDVVDVLAVMTWLHRDAMIAKIEAEIDLAADEAAALDATRRAERVAETAAEILKLERREEALIRQARAAGLPIARRPDADPRAVLGLGPTAPAPEGE